MGRKFLFFVFITVGKDVENLSQIRIKSSSNYSVTEAAACLEHDAGQFLSHLT